MLSMDIIDPYQPIRDQLIIHEGMRLKPYKDNVGKLTIGVGRNLDDVGISREEAMQLLDNDINIVMDSLDLALPWWRTLDDLRSRAIIDMVFNLGITRFLGFKQMLIALKAKQYDLAAQEMLDSKWAKQVGIRAQTLAAMMRHITL